MRAPGFPDPLVDPTDAELDRAEAERSDAREAAHAATLPLGARVGWTDAYGRERTGMVSAIDDISSSLRGADRYKVGAAPARGAYLYVHRDDTDDTVILPATLLHRLPTRLVGDHHMPPSTDDENADAEDIYPGLEDGR